MGTVAKALNQSTLVTTETYAHLAEDPLREAVDQQRDNLAQVLQIETGGGVVDVILPDDKKESV